VGADRQSDGTRALLKMTFYILLVQVAIGARWPWMTEATRTLDQMRDFSN
jgi:hypothetical protein